MLLDFFDVDAGAELVLELAGALAGAAIVGAAAGALLFAVPELVGVLEAAGAVELSLMLEDFLLFFLPLVPSEEAVDDDPALAESAAIASDLLLFLDFLPDVALLSALAD